MQPNISEISIDDVLTGKFKFDPEFQVSKHSKFSDPEWIFYDSESARLNSVPQSRLRVNWEAYANGEEEILLPQSIINELQILTVIYLDKPVVLTGRTKQLKPSTVVISVRALARLISSIFQTSFISNKPVLKGLTHISSISDISFDEVKVAVLNSSFKDGALVKKMLIYLTSPAFNKYLPKSITWGSKDIDSLEFKYEKKRPDHKRVMPNDLFRFLSNNACDDVINFLQFLEIEPADKTIQNECNSEILKLKNGKEIFETYTRIRVIDRDATHKKNTKSHFASFEERRKFKSKFGLKPEKMLEAGYRAQRAAYTVIALYTGARYSDQTTFQVGCIKSVHGAYVLSGTLVKGEDLNKLEDNDYWPAIPIMRDALRCLEEISKITFNPYLISGRQTVRVDQIPKPLSHNGLANAITNYLHEIDLTSRWESYKINTHQLRHTLAFQLARADVGLMFIAHQMKHLYTALSALPPSVTLTYGNVTDIAASRALGTTEAYFEAAKNLYDPDMPVAGGGSEEFKKRRKQYFEGMAAAGWTSEQIISHLAKQGLPFASVGVGYCAGRRDRLLKDGTREISPCIGTLQCNPGKCHQAIITQTHVPQWHKIYQHNLKMENDENMAHAHDLYRIAAEEAKSVLRGLGEI